MKRKSVQKKVAIPIHPLPLHNGANTGVVIRRLIDVNPANIHQKQAHRDDHYQFIFQEKGRSCLNVDFNEVILNANDILCILPGQVHRAISATHSYAWIISVQSEWVSETYQSVFETLLLQTAVPLNKYKAAILTAVILLLEKLSSDPQHFYFSRQMLLGTTETCLGIFADAYKASQITDGTANTQPAVILRQFRTMLSRSYKTMKSPSAYAATLNISPAYLNEVIKEKTGFPVSYWIQREIITEARRLLYYTDLSVKELADTLGYEDHSYFSRFFKKAEGITPIDFRELSRK